jgi:V/A-type H+/Na+-transporting ATPase subunit K
MDIELMAATGKAGAAAVLGLAAVGSALGTGTAGMAAVGAWKKCYAQSKAAPFILITFIGAPLSQTIYGMILMLQVNGAIDALVADGASFIAWPMMLSMGLFGGLGMAASAWYQGKAGAAGADALSETGQGFGNYLMTIGIVETVALFVLVFMLILL